MIDAHFWYKFLSFAHMLNLSFVYCFSICQGIPISAFCPMASTCVIKVDKHLHQIVQIFFIYFFSVLHTHFSKYFTSDYLFCTILH